MPSARTASALIAALLALGLSGCHGAATNEHKAELLRELRSRVTAYRPTPEEAEAPQLSETYARVFSVQEAVSDALGRIGADAVPALTKALSDPDAHVRMEAAHALALIGPPAKAAVPELTRLLDDPSEEVRRGAARALGQIGPAASSAVPALLRLLERPAAPPAATSPSSPDAS